MWSGLKRPSNRKERIIKGRQVEKLKEIDEEKNDEWFVARYDGDECVLYYTRDLLKRNQRERLNREDEGCMNKSFRIKPVLAED